ncbi:MAG: FAD binding domain-containing protein [Planctomycetes bacterium]|nr:FAD binding domain-containing protein [Planctomycetota bacterium]
MKPFEYVTAETFESAAAFLSSTGPGTLVKAGGVDLLDRLKERLDAPERVLNLRPLHDPVDTIKARPTERLIVLNTLTTLAEIAAHPGLRERLPALAHAAAETATPQIRNLATLGGNLCQKPRCWYFRSQDYRCLKKGGGTCYAVDGDNRYHAIFGAAACHIVHPSSLAVPLLAYAAQVRLVKRSGDTQTERVVPLSEFFRVPADPQQDENSRAPDELLTEVLISLADTGPRSAYVELREKQSFGWPLVCCAVNLTKPEQPRVVLGAVAPRPWRLERVEQLIAGCELSEALITQAGQAARRGAKPLRLNGYKVQLADVAVQRALRQAHQAGEGG